MKKIFDKVAIVTKPGFSPAEKLGKDICSKMKALGFKLHLDDGPVLPSDIRTGEIDLAVIVGGDGTILSTSRRLDSKTAILGIALGGRGILSEVKPEGIDRAFDLLAKGHFSVENRIRLQVSTEEMSFPPALNEVYMVRQEYNVTPTYKISCGNRFNLEQRMDGIMISTPTGSTGHSYTLGAPIIAEDLDAILLTPVCATPSLHPIVLPPQEIVIESEQASVIVVDGQGVFKGEGKTPIRVDKCLENILFVRFSDKKLRQLSNLGTI